MIPCPSKHPAHPYYFYVIKFSILISVTSLRLALFHRQNDYKADSATSAQYYLDVVTNHTPRYPPQLNSAPKFRVIMKCSECSHPNLLVHKSEVDLLKISARIHGIKNNLFFIFKVVQRPLWNTSDSLNHVISQGFCLLCQVTHELQLFSWWTIAGCCWSIGTVHVTQLVLRMVEIMAACFLQFPFFLWRGISSLGSHIRFVHSSAFPRGKCTLFLWFVGCCHTQPFLQTLIP